MTQKHDRSVAIVDDDKAVRKALSLSISHAGYRALPMTDGKAIIEYMSNGYDQPDCVLLDIRMPGVDGTKVLPQLRALDPTVPVIMVTANNDLDTAVACMSEGAFYYVVKPVERPVLVSTIRRALELRDAQDEARRLRAENERYQHRLEEMVDERTAQLQDALSQLHAHNLETVEALAGTIEAKDPYTRGHCTRVRDYSLALARSAGLSASELSRIEYGALLHDIGKIAVPGVILAKPSRLDDNEFAALREHPVKGETILRPVAFFSEVLPIIRHHHERYDGAGYPDGLSGEQIDRAARIVSVADAFDAMTSTRPYRPALDRSTARGRLQEGAGTQFDADLVERFLAMSRPGTNSSGG